MIVSTGAVAEAADCGPGAGWLTKMSRTRSASSQQRAAGGHIQSPPRVEQDETFILRVTWADEQDARWRPSFAQRHRCPAAEPMRVASS